MTQDRLDASLDIDLLSPIEIVRVIQAEDATIAPAVAAEAQHIAHAIDQITDRMLHSGRLFYIGAGTSGRIAMLDASELPPTYGINPDLVHVIIAGGERAFLHAVEGAEDDEDAAIEAINANVKAEACAKFIRFTSAPVFTHASAVSL